MLLSLCHHCIGSYALTTMLIIIKPLCVDYFCENINAYLNNLLTQISRPWDQKGHHYFVSFLAKLPFRACHEQIVLLAPAEIIELMTSGCLDKSLSALCQVVLLHNKTVIVTREAIQYCIRPLFAISRKIPNRSARGLKFPKCYAMFQSFCNLRGASATPLPRRLSNYRAMNIITSNLRGSRPCDKTFYRLLRQVHTHRNI